MTHARVTEFEQRVYELCRRIPAGRVSTYKAIADALGMRGCQAVGNALHKNPFAPKVPCHRVVCSDGRVGSFAWGNTKKQELLKKEGIVVVAGKIKEFEKQLLNFMK